MCAYVHVEGVVGLQREKTGSNSLDKELKVSIQEIGAAHASMDTGKPGKASGVETNIQSITVFLFPALAFLSPTSCRSRRAIISMSTGVLRKIFSLWNRP